MQFHFKIADAERDRENVAATSTAIVNPHAALQPQQPQQPLVDPKDTQHEIRLQLVVDAPIADDITGIPSEIERIC